MDTHETKIYSIILIAAAILGIIVAYFIFTIIRYQRKNLLLHKDKLLAEINTLENERKRIASDLHDELGPLLSAVKLHINCVEGSDTESMEMIGKANMHIDTILTRMREISNDLMPQALSRKGLSIAIREFIDNLNALNYLDIKFMYAEDIKANPDTEIHLYRIILEIIQNTIKHAGASQLKIECRRNHTKLIMLAADDGQGFEYSEINKSSMGLGLKNILSRVEIVKGELFIDTAPGKGTTYTIEIPLTN